MANRGNTWSIPTGESQTYSVSVVNGAGTVITGQYAGSEALEALVWEGSTIAPIANVLTNAWASPNGGPNGQTTVTVTAATTASMLASYYRVRLSVTFAGQKSPYYYGWLRLLPSPGSATDAPTYNSLQDLLDKAGDWLPRLQQETGEANFVAQRARARSWLDDIIVGRSRVFAFRTDLAYALYYGSFPFGPVEAPDSVIAAYLASNFLMVDDHTREIVTYKALSLICENRMSFDATGDEFSRRASWYRKLASNSVRGYRPTLDTNADGKADIAFNLGVFTFR